MKNPTPEGCSTVDSHWSSSVPAGLSAQLSICIFASQSLAESCQQVLSSERYNLTVLSSLPEIFHKVSQHKHNLDCLVLQHSQKLLPVLNQLYSQGILLPVVIVQASSAQTDNAQSTRAPGELDGATNPYLYHPAEVLLPVSKISEVALFVDRALAEFLKLSPIYGPSEESGNVDPATSLTHPDFFRQQRVRLAEKLKERLGYLAVYYKRNPKHFFRHLSSSEKEKLLEELKSEYGQIILNYFEPNNSLNQRIDDFVNQVFFADLAVSQIVELHMELMDEFANQLKLEGRSEEFLLDYRLTLIDIIAHLCEMYRRSIPKEL